MSKLILEDKMKQKHINYNDTEKKMDECKGDFIFAYASGKTHSFTTGHVSLDGSGAKRSYGHIVADEECATVTVSLANDEVLCVWHDRILCNGCQNKLTHLI